MHVLDLNGAWFVTFTEDEPEPWAADTIAGREGFTAQVPEPIHTTLMRAGVIGDINIGLGALHCRWVEEQFWIYRRTFEVEEVGSPARLCFDLLEFDARVHVNGVEVGRHQNAHRPARIEVGHALRVGSNSLAVILEVGMRTAQDKPVAGWLPSVQSDLSRRHWLRKPQYQGGWDWNPRLQNLGILGDVRLEVGRLRVDDPSLFTLADGTATCAFSLSGVESAEARLEVAGVGVSEQVGVGRALLGLSVPDPELWWPVGLGEQKLYDATLVVVAHGERYEKRWRTGFRTVEIDQPPHPMEGRYFILKVNGRPTFWKGANWVPPDMLYSTVTPDRIYQLVDIALRLNFNLLRVWGGANYAPDALAEACAEKGLMLWHDFAFACAKYPWPDPAWAEETRQELRYQIRRLSAHPSMAVWCGNNEIEALDAEWTQCHVDPIRPHQQLFFEVMPEMLAEEGCPLPYWPSSPYSPDGRLPSDPTVGDQHPWAVSLGSEGAADWWRYREQVDRFPNEGGVLGASSLRGLRRMLPESERRILSPTWQFHDNRFGYNGAAPGEEGRCYQTVRKWTGIDPFTLSWERYALLSGLLQAEALREYILNYRARMFSSACAVFWMFNDSWPTTHGWTTQDYDLNPKLSFHPVRRAFQPVTVGLGRRGDHVVAYGLNDTNHVVEAELRAGLFAFDGSSAPGPYQPVALAPNAATELARIPVASIEASRQGVRAVLRYEGGEAQDRMLFGRFGDLLLEPEPTIHQRVEQGCLVLEADKFVWGVMLDTEGDPTCPDNAFDLLPGVPYRVHAGEGSSVLAHGNLLMHREM